MNMKSKNEITLNHAHFVSKILTPLLTFFDLLDDEFTALDPRAFNEKERQQAVPVNTKVQAAQADVVRANGKLGFFLSLLGAHTHFFNFYKKGKKVEPAKIKFKILKPWIISRVDNVQVDNPYFSVLKYLSHPCPNLCRFCLHMNDVPETRSNLPIKISDSEIDLRLKHYDPQGKKALFSSQEYHYNEYINHPRFFEIARKIRKKTGRMLEVITSAIPLNESILAGLQEIEPVLFYISLNCVSPEYRKKVLGDPHPERTLDMIRKLPENRIHFFTSIVHDEALPLSELEKTIRFAAENKTAVIRITLQAYSRHHPRYRPDWDRDSFYKEVTSFVQKIRHEVDAPIVLQPVYCNDRPAEAVNKSYVIGIIPGSPAFKAGLKHGDYILSVENQDVDENPTHARKILGSLYGMGIDFSLNILRDSKQVTIKFKADQQSEYPFSQMGVGDKSYYPLGIVLNEGIFPETIDEIVQVVNKHSQAKSGDVLVLTSSLMRPLIEKKLSLREVSSPVYYKVPEHTYWGGNIIIGDIYTAVDYLKAIQEWEQERGTPGLIIMPASPFGNWGYDLSGVRARGVLADYNVYFVGNNIIPAMG